MNKPEIFIYRKARKGDKSAFEFLFKEHYQALYLYALKLLKNEEAAKDMIQDLFTNLWHNRERIDEQKSIKGFLFTSLHNNCLNYLKHRQVKEKFKTYKMSRISEIEQDYYLSHGNHLSRLVAKELKEKIDEVVGSLPEKCRKIFKMSRYDNLKSREIGEKLGLSTRTVENQIYRALKVLQEQLKEYW